MRISDWSSDVCSSDLAAALVDGDVDHHAAVLHVLEHLAGHHVRRAGAGDEHGANHEVRGGDGARDHVVVRIQRRSKEHTSELQSLMRTSYAVFCLKNKPQYQY